MELRDLIVTPVVLLLLYVIAYLVRPWVTDEVNRKYFIPGFTVRVIGALALGFLYQFYYGGGDTYNFHTYGSRHIWEAFVDSPLIGLKLMFADGEYDAHTFKYASRIPFYHDGSSYMLIKIAVFFDLFTFSSYSATALFFAAIGFTGSWCLFTTFYSNNERYHREIALITLFVPSVFFWGSGLMKDTVTLASLGISTFILKRLFIDHRFGILKVAILFLALYLIYEIKVYVLLCFLPAATCWLGMSMISTIRSKILRVMVLPFGLVLTFAIGYLAIREVGSKDKRYQLDMLAETARVTAYDIAFQTGRDAGSTYSLGELDGTFSGLLRLAPKAVNVSLFRPYLWEVRNPLMLMAAVESVIVMFFFIYIFFKSFRFLSTAFTDPTVIFCLMFSITFAFAVGVSTFNFGTLSRYKIPLVPYFLMALLLIYHRAKSARKLAELEATEYA